MGWEWYAVQDSPRQVVLDGGFVAQDKPDGLRVQCSLLASHWAIPWTRLPVILGMAASTSFGLSLPVQATINDQSSSSSCATLLLLGAYRREGRGGHVWVGLVTWREYRC